MTPRIEELLRRLARAKGKRDEEQLLDAAGVQRWPGLRDARQELMRAAEALADELVAEGYGQ